MFFRPIQPRPFRYTRAWGSHVLEASYAGDTDLAAAGSNPVTVAVHAGIADQPHQRAERHCRRVGQQPHAPRRAR
jgi:hypothetical protein